ncbi:MAG: ABC transporter substrate-binding protein, partial [Clostridia bacterium]
SQYAEVRQAVTYLMDRNEFAKQYTEGYGTSLSGYYGLGQQEYILNKEWVDKTLNAYTFSVDKAIEVLVKGGWIYDETGADFSSGIRHKKLDDGTFMPLILKWNSTTPNPMSDQIATCLTEEIQAKAGLKIDRTNTDFSTLLDNMTQSGGVQEYNMFNLAVGFTPISAHWYYFDPKMGGEYNREFLDDKEIYEIALGMKTIPSEDTAAWDAEWKKLQKRWNYLMPSVPLYSNIYYDFFNKKLTNYNTNSQWTWYYDMPFAKVA